MPGKKRSIIVRILRITGITLLGLILLLFLAPILFRKQLIGFAKRQLNNQLTATVDFKDVRISLLRHFPRLDLKFVNLSIIGKDPFKGDTLLYSPSTHIITNFKTLFRSNVMIYAVELDEPTIHAKVNADGKQNFDIVKSSSGSSTGGGKEFSIDLEKYSITNGTISYDDEPSMIHSRMKHFNHSGKGNFSGVKYLVSSNTRADSVYFDCAGLTYLQDAVIDLPVDLNIDDGTRKYNFIGDNIIINTVPLETKGEINAVNDSTDNLNITVKTKKADFKNILTLLPGVLTENIKDFQTNGQAVIDGKISGLVTANRTPDFNIRIDVSEGYIKNPEFNEPIQNLNVNASIVNTGGKNDSTKIRLTNGSARIGAEPIQFALGITHPVTSMWLDFFLRGKVQLEKLKSILKLGNMDLRGLLHADIEARGPLSAFTEKEANIIRASGILTADNFYYKDKGILPFHARQVIMNFTNTEGNVVVVDGNYNNTSVSAKGSIYNFFNYLFVNAPLRGKFVASSPRINVADWNTGSGGGGGVNAGGSKPFVVPANILLDIDAHTDQLISDKIVMNDLSGKIFLAGRKMLFENMQGKVFGGTMNVNGSYSSEKTPLQPDITLNYKMMNLDVQQTFNAIITAGSLMPIGKYLSGTVSSELSATGKLGDDLSPLLQTLAGNGNLLLLNGLLRKFAPLEKIADRLGIDRLRNIATREIKNHFTFENGMVNVLPFKFTIFDNYNFEIAGRHGFDNSMDYAIKLSLPRKELGLSGVNLLGNLLSKIGKIGFVFKPDEKISFFMHLTGTINAPDLDIQLDKTVASEFDNLKKQAEDQIKGKIDNAKNVLQDSIKNIKDDILHGLKNKILNKPDSTIIQLPKKDSSVKKAIIKSVIDIFTRKNKKDSL